MGFLDGVEKATRVVQALASVEWERILVREKKHSKGAKTDLTSIVSGRSSTEPEESMPTRDVSSFPGAPTPGIVSTPTPNPTPNPRPPGPIPQRHGVPDEVLLKDARQRLKDEGLKLRSHLSSGCAIAGYPCDCCEKGMVNVDHALEDILAVTPGDDNALAFHNWIVGHRSELEANHAIEQKRGLELASEVRSHLKVCGAAPEAPAASLESLSQRVQNGELTIEQAQTEARKMGAQAHR